MWYREAVNASCTQPYASAHGAPILTEDLTRPIVVVAVNPSPAERAVNRSKMSTPGFLGRRVRVRINPEVFTKLATSRWAFHRLTQQFAKLSFPDAQQAEHFCDALMDFCAQFEGKLLSSPSHSQSLDNERVR